MKKQLIVKVMALLTAALLAVGMCACSSSAGSNSNAGSGNANTAANSTATNANANSGKNTTNANTAANSSQQSTSNLTFRSYSLMKSHYEKHGIDMGFSSMEDYLAAANAVVANSKSLHKTEAEDGDDIYYLESTNEIVFVSQDGYIRTYFCPDTGKKYYDKQ